MSHPFYPSGSPRFNHVAMSVPGDLLNEENRGDICRFWGEVFGFDELPTMTLDRRRLVLSCVDWDQFVFIVGDGDPMQCPRMDHFGLSVRNLDEMVGVEKRALAYQEHDDRVDIIPAQTDDHGVVKIHSIYVKFLLPMMCELQWWELPSPS
jgi:hypothetical protein